MGGKKGKYEGRIMGGKKERLVRKKKREEDTKEYGYDGMGFADAFHWLPSRRLVRDEALKNNWQKKQ